MRSVLVALIIFAVPDSSVAGEPPNQEKKQNPIHTLEFLRELRTIQEEYLRNRPFGLPAPRMDGDEFQKALNEEKAKRVAALSRERVDSGISKAVVEALETNTAVWDSWKRFMGISKHEARKGVKNRSNPWATVFRTIGPLAVWERETQGRQADFQKKWVTALKTFHRLHRKNETVKKDMKIFLDIPLLCSPLPQIGQRGPSIPAYHKWSPLLIRAKRTAQVVKLHEARKRYRYYFRIELRSAGTLNVVAEGTARPLSVELQEEKKVNRGGRERLTLDRVAKPVEEPPLRTKVSAKLSPGVYRLTVRHRGEVINGATIAIWIGGSRKLGKIMKQTPVWDSLDPFTLPYGLFK